jgi:endonuclease YncB( thermonuclease family)
MRSLLTLLFLFCTASTLAAPCAVTSVSDGDTLTVRCGDRGAERVDLFGVAAPTKGDKYFVRSRDALEALCGGRDVEVNRVGRDANRRMSAYVVCDGVNVNRKMIETGNARVNRHQIADPDLIDLETEAKAMEKGVWRK